MNSRNYPLAGSPESDRPQKVTIYVDGHRPHPEDDAAGEASDEQQRFARNRAESLQLCNDFHAFYAAHPAYHIDL